MIALATTTVVATIPLTGNPYGVVVSPDGAHVYVAKGNVLVIDTATNAKVARIPVGGSPIGMAIGPPVIGP